MIEIQPQGGVKIKEKKVFESYKKFHHPDIKLLVKEMKSPEKTKSDKKENK